MLMVPSKYPHLWTDINYTEKLSDETGPPQTMG